MHVGPAITMVVHLPIARPAAVDTTSGMAQIDVTTIVRPTGSQAVATESVHEVSCFLRLQIIIPIIVDCVTLLAVHAKAGQLSLTVSHVCLDTI